MSWLKRERSGIKTDKKADRPDLPEGLWTKCDGCGEALFQSVLEEHMWTCPHCNFHFRIPARTYLDYLVDEGSFVECDANLHAADPLEFRDAKMRYPDRLKGAQRETGMMDAALSGTATVAGKPVALTIMDFFFMGGSMGSVVGEKVARSIERATFSPTTEPMLPPMKKKSMSVTLTGLPPTVATPESAASFMPVSCRAAESRSG